MEELIYKLKDKLSYYSTEEILGYIAMNMIVMGNDGESIAKSSDLISKTNLDSPQKQFLYLIGLLMSTDYVENVSTELDEKSSDSTTSSNQSVDEENEIKEQLHEEEMQEILSMLKLITTSYVFNFIPKDKKEIETIDEEKKKQIDVSLPIFLAYFNMAVLRYEEQIIDRIYEWVAPFDAILEDRLGCNSADLIAFYEFVEKKFQNSIEEAQDAGTSFFSQAMDDWEKIKNQYEKATSEEDISKIFDDIIIRQSGDITEIATVFQEKMNNMMTISSKDIVSEFGENKANAILNYLSLERRSRDFIYYTGDNPVYSKPLCKVKDGRFFVVHPKYVLEGIYHFLINCLEEMHRNNLINFYRIRGDKTEETTEMLFKRILGENACIYKSVCEIPKSEEHDLLIQYKDKLIIVEIKSSKVKEPMRNPEKAYLRIRDNFFGKSGIGGGYYQAVKLKNFIMSKDEVTLYHDKEVPFTLRHKDFTEILTVVITAEQFGPLNINMSSLLQPEEGERYPWSCNLYDFENLIEMFMYLKRTSDDFIEYIRQRILYHEKFICFDELEIAENFLIEGDFNRFRNKDKIFFMPQQVNLMDKIYYEKKGIEYEYPYLPKSKVKKKFGRNDPCSCGSGKKFKKCCGSN